MDPIESRVNLPLDFPLLMGYNLTILCENDNFIGGVLVLKTKYEKPKVLDINPNPLALGHCSVGTTGKSSGVSCSNGSNTGANQGHTCLNGGTAGKNKCTVGSIPL